MSCKTIKLLFLPFCFFCFSGCFSIFEPGSATYIKKFKNLSGTKQAILFLKYGNATAGNSLQVSIKNVKDDLEKTEVGNTFTVDNDHGKAHLGSSSINFKWLNDKQLTITYDKKFRTFIMENNVDGVEVIYSAL